MFKLCYIESHWAWFTTAELKDQWGDDWNDTHYEYNAGTPYEWYDGTKCSEYKLFKIAFDGPMSTPEEIAGSNSPYSVRMINWKHVPWLRHEEHVVWAGDTIEQFVKIVEASGGNVYFPGSMPKAM